MGSVPVPGEIFMAMSVFDCYNAPITSKQIEQWTNVDPTLSMVKRCVISGIWSTVPYEFHHKLRPYLARKNESSLHSGCMLWGSRVIAPPKCQNKVCDELHASHPGIVTMKSIARSHVWWPGIDENLESYVRHCSVCQATALNSPEAPLHM